jgi:hypothetical protein
VPPRGLDSQRGLLGVSSEIDILYSLVGSPLVLFFFSVYPDLSQWLGGSVFSHSPEKGAPPTQFTAIKEQLGLKFERVKAPVDALVIDSIEPPAAN